MKIILGLCNGGIIFTGTDSKLDQNPKTDSWSVQLKSRRT